MKYLIGLFALLGSVSASASELQVWGRDYTFSCSYFSSMHGDVDVTYQDSTLPWGTKVAVVAGWEGREGMPNERRFTWRDRTEYTAVAVSPFTWKARISTVLHERSHAEMRDGLNFVLKITAPGQAPRFLNGGSTWSYFRSRLVGSSVSNCVSGSGDLPAFRRLQLDVVNRD